MNIVVDIEADGPVPGLYSMVSFGAVVVEPGLKRTFYGQCAPISEDWVPEALAVSGHTREETLTFPRAFLTMHDFNNWLMGLGAKNNRFIFWADNNGFDWQFINYYFHYLLNKNPFGFSSQNINSLYKGATGELRSSFKHLRKTKHTHHPVDDAKGNAEAMLAMQEKYGFKFY